MPYCKGTEDELIQFYNKDDNERGVNIYFMINKNRKILNYNKHKISEILDFCYNFTKDEIVELVTNIIERNYKIQISQSYKVNEASL